MATISSSVSREGEIRIKVNGLFEESAGFRSQIVTAFERRFGERGRGREAEREREREGGRGERERERTRGGGREEQMNRIGRRWGRGRNRSEALLSETVANI